MPRPLALKLTIAALITIPAIAAEPDPFSQHVRPTDPLSPQEELAALHVPMMVHHLDLGHASTLPAAEGLGRVGGPTE